MRSTRQSLSEIFKQPGDSPMLMNDMFSESTSKESEHLCLSPDRSDALGIPYVVIPRGDDIEDFFATAATYHSSFLPISAYVHVVSGELFRQVEQAMPVQNQQAGELWQAVAGCCLGEAVAQLVAKAGEVVTPTFSIARRSLSFAVARTFRLFPLLDPGVITRRWRSATELGRFESSKKVEEAALEAIQLLLGQISFPARPKDRGSLLLRGTSLFIRGELPDSELQRLIFSSYLGSEKLIDDLKGPFSRRLEALESLSRIIFSEGLGPADFVALGYITNLVLPGSFSHLQVLVRLSQAEPSAIIWYSIFSSLRPTREASPQLRGLRLKLVRELFEDFSIEQRPTADISIEELVVLSRLSLTNAVLKPAHHRAIEVSLLPGISVASRFSEQDESSDDLEREKERERHELYGLHQRLRSLMLEALGNIDGYFEVQERKRKAGKRRV